MHAKETVCDNIVFVGSFTISSPGERNAENALEIRNASFADRIATCVDEIRARY